MSTQPIPEGHDPRVVRARSLANELVETMQHIAHECRGADAVLFLELVERCNGYTESELTLADASETMAMAREVRAVDGAILGTAAASALDIDGVAERLWDVLEDSTTPVVPLVLDALTLATIAPALPDEHRQDAEDACDQAIAVIESHPEVFEEAIAIAIDRARFERPSRLPQTARDLIRVLRSLPELADEDVRADHAELPSFARDQLARARKELEAKKDPWAISGSDTWLAHLSGLLQPRSMQPTLLADSGAPRKALLLRKLRRGNVFVVAIGNDLFLQWEGDGATPSLYRSSRHDEVLAAIPFEDGVRWKIEPPFDGAEFELHLGANRISLKLPARK